MSGTRTNVESVDRIPDAILPLDWLLTQAPPGLELPIVSWQQEPDSAEIVKVRKDCGGLMIVPSGIVQSAKSTVVAFRKLRFSGKVMPAAI